MRGATFSWVNALLAQGFHGQLTMAQLWPLNDDDSCASLHKTALARITELQAGVPAGTQVPLWRLLISMCRRQLLVALCFATVYACTQVLNPVLIRLVVRSVGQESEVCLFSVSPLQRGPVVPTTVVLLQNTATPLLLTIAHRHSLFWV